MKLVSSTPLEFVVARVSANMGDFGHYGHVVMARTGEAYELSVIYLYKKNQGDRVQATVNVYDNGDRAVRFQLENESARFLGTAPLDIAAQAFEGDAYVPKVAKAPAKGRKAKPAKPLLLSDSVPTSRSHKAKGIVTADELNGAWR